MSKLEVIDYDKMEKAINTLDSVEKDLGVIFDNIYKLQEEFKKNHGGTYLETAFIQRNVMSSYVKELNANKRWLQNYSKELKEADNSNEKQLNGLDGGSNRQNDGIDSSSSSKTASASSGLPNVGKIGQEDVITGDDSKEKTLGGSAGKAKVNATRVASGSTMSTITSAIHDTMQNRAIDSSATSLEKFLGSASDYHSKLVSDKGWKWSSAGLFYYDIKKSTYHPKKLTCCATYVASILYLSGLFTESEINNKKGWNYNHPEGIKELCQSKNWTKITNVKDVKAGDIVFYWGGGKEYGRTTGHVMIYAGDGKWYNGGSTKSLQSAGPAYYGPPSGNFAFAYRMP